MGQVRHGWMDLLRGAAVLLVVLWHAAVVPGRFGIEAPLGAVLVKRLLSPYPLPIFLILSGILLDRSLAKPLRAYLSGKVRAILWSFVVWTVITCLLWQPARLLDPVTWYAGADHMWFMTTLMVCFLVAPVLHALRIPWVVVAAGLWTAWFLLPLALPGVANWVWYGAYFFLGAALGGHVTRIASAPRWVVFVLAAVVMVGVAGVLTGSQGYAWRPHWLVISLAGAGLLIWGAPRIPEGWVRRRLEEAGRVSIVCYLAHVPAILLVGPVWTALDLPGGWFAFVAFATAAVGVPWLISLWPPAWWLFRFRGPARSAAVRANA